MVTIKKLTKEKLDILAEKLSEKQKKFKELRLERQKKLEENKQNLKK